VTESESKCWSFWAAVQACWCKWCLKERGQCIHL